MRSIESTAGRLASGPLLTSLGVTRRRLRRATMTATGPDNPRTPPSGSLPAAVRFDFGWLDGTRTPSMHTMVVRPMTPADVDPLAAATDPGTIGCASAGSTGAGSADRAAGERLRQLLRRRLAEQAAGDGLVLLAESDTVLAGYLRVSWRSDYPPFRAADIPEIADLDVFPPHRRQGVATMLLEVAEAAVATRSAMVGIGVGLHAACGPAQRLYAKRGFVPDGRGVYHACRPVNPNAPVPLDDSVALMLVKRVR